MTHDSLDMSFSQVFCWAPMSLPLSEVQHRSRVQPALKECSTWMILLRKTIGGHILNPPLWVSGEPPKWLRLSCWFPFKATKTGYQASSKRHNRWKSRSQNLRDPDIQFGHLRPGLPPHLPTCRGPKVCKGEFSHSKPPTWQVTFYTQCPLASVKP